MASQFFTSAAWNGSSLWEMGRQGVATLCLMHFLLRVAALLAFLSILAGEGGGDRASSAWKGDRHGLVRCSGLQGCQTSVGAYPLSRVPTDLDELAWTLVRASRRPSDTQPVV